MNLTDLQKEAHAIAKDHGWWDEERTFGDCIALVHSELSEALEAYREDPTMGTSLHNPSEAGGSTVVGSRFLVKPVGVASELADVVIRVADMAEYYGCNLEAAETIDPSTESFYADLVSFGDWIEACGIWLSFTFLEKLLTPDFHPARPLAQTLLWVQATAAHYGIDLDAAIEAKTEYNRTRSYRHGGKAL